MGLNILYKYLLIFCLFFMPIWVQAQKVHIRGVISEVDSTLLCCSVIRIKDSPFRTVASDVGQFQFQFTKEEFENSSKILLVGSVGFEYEEIDLSKLDSVERLNLKIYLKRETYIMQEVVVSQVNPANRLIQEAIDNRKKHLLENSGFKARVYLKGVQKLKQLPEKILGFDTDPIVKELVLDSNRTGIVYLSESESLVWSQPPNKFKEELVKSRISGNNRSFSFNRASDLQLNFYENTHQIISGLSPRPFISPISDYAFQYYRYRYLGFSEIEGNMVNKIQVIPRRKGEPLMNGVIYLLEGEGRIVGVDLEVDSSYNLQFVNSLKIQQQFFQENSGKWYSSGAALFFDVEFLGVKIEGNFIAHYLDYQEIGPDESINFNEKLKIQAEAVETDTSYWNRFRPVPLHEEEIKDYQVKDSVRTIRETPAYLDSLDREYNRFKLIPFVISGYNFRNRASHLRGEIDGLINSLNFNLVEGINLQYGMGISKILDTLYRTELSFKGKLRYGFHNERFNPSLEIAYRKPMKMNFSIALGRDLQDFNSQNTYPEWVNSAYILLGGKNYFKLYERTFVNMRADLNAPLNSLFSIDLFYNKRNFLENTIEYSFLSPQHRRFTSNLPSLLESENNLLQNHENWGISLSVKTDFSTQYQSLPSGKRYLPSRLPVLTLEGRWANQAFSGLNQDYTYVGVGVEKKGVSLNRWGKVSYQVHYGKFFGDPLFITDFAHLTTGNFLISKFDQSSFLTLDRYSFASSDYQIQAHFHYNLGTLITSKIPLVRNLFLQEWVNFHYLSNEKIDHLLELNVGLSAFGLHASYAKPLVIERNHFNLPISKHAFRILYSF